MESKEEQLMKSFELLRRPTQLIAIGMAGLLADAEENFRRQIQVFLQNPAIEPKPRRSKKNG